MTDHTPDDDIVVRPFADFLQDQSKGHTHAELGEALHDLVAKVRDTGKKGMLRLELFVEPLKADSKVLTVTDKITLKLPEHDRAASIFYADKSGNLSRTNPDQLTFDSLRDVSASADDAPTHESREA